MSFRVKNLALAALLALSPAVVRAGYYGGDHFNDRVTFTVKGASKDLTGFPLLVRVSEAQLPGFKYSRAKSNELAFVSSDGATLLPYDVDTWDESGESLIWVKADIPKTGIDITMFWSLKDGEESPENEPGDVWSEYAGVWHMNGTVESTTNHVSGTIGSTSAVTNGIFGAAIGSSGDGEPLLLAETGSAIDSLVDGGDKCEFTISFWTRLNSTTDGGTSDQFLFSRRGTVRTVWNDAGYALSINNTRAPGESADVGLACGDAGYKYSNTAQALKGVVRDGWMRNDVVYSKLTNRFSWYVNGKLDAENGYSRDITYDGHNFENGNLEKIAIGGRVVTGADATCNVNGAMDEFRMRSGGVDETRFKAEYENETQTSYLDATCESFVLPGSVFVDGEESDYWTTNDYWIASPSMTNVAWTSGMIDADALGLFGGAIRSGCAIQYAIVDAIDPSSTNGVYTTSETLKTALVKLREGRYRLSCSGVETETEERDVEFTVKLNIDDTYLDHVTFTLNGIGTAPIADYAMLLRLSEAQLPGFRYARVGAADRIAFTDVDGNSLYYDVDEWNPTGESLVWVKVPVATNGTAVTMHWALAPGKDAAPYYPSEVWSDYVGVWHFNEEITSASAATMNSLDATGNGYDAVPSSGTNGNAARMVSVEGALGKGRQIETGVVKIGNHLTLANSADMELNGAFTISGWMNMEGASASRSDFNYIFSRKLDRNNSDGFCAIINRSAYVENELKTALVYGGSSSLVSARVSKDDTSLTQAEWTYFSFAFNNTSLSAFAANKTGAWTANGTIAAATDNNMPISLGQSSEAAPEFASFWGAFDEFRIRKTAVSAVQSGIEYANATFTNYLDAAMGDSVSFLVPGAVVMEGTVHDYWRVMPSISDARWEKGHEPDSVVYTPGELRSGAELAVTCELVSGGTVLAYPFTSDDLKGLEAGSYLIRCKRADDAATALDDAIVYFTITKPAETISVGDTADGRILLMNNDWTTGTASNPQITGQGWVNTNLTGSATGTFWEHEEVDFDDDTADNVMPGTGSTLWSVVEGGAVTNRLWTLVDCRHGNTFPQDDDSPLNPGQNYLPFSAKSASIKETTMEETYRDGVGQLLMRNALTAAVYSPCYTNGIDTIYFDAVNGWNHNITDLDGNTNTYKIVVEISKADPDTEWNNASDWAAVPCHVVHVNALAAERLTEVATTEEITFAVDGNGTTNEFLRVYAPIEERGNVRFRIRRTGIDGDGSLSKDSSAYILIDNIVASYPRTTATLKSAGQYFDRRGKNVLGEEGAFVDGVGVAILPVAGDTVYGRAVPEYYVNSATSLGSTSIFASARMHYRWRYLNQLLGEWRTVSLDPENGFRSFERLTLPDMAGDVEFWFDATLSAPYHKPVDYSGLELTEEFVSTIYAERVVDVSSAAAGRVYPSAGTNWFVRLREDSSAYEGVYLHTRASGSSVCETNAMHLVEDGQWRGFVKTVSPISGGLDFRFEGVKLGVDAGGGMSFTTNRWTAADDARDEIPASRGLEAGDGWRTAMCDATTRYLVFTFDENRETITICRGDMQDFDKWSSAVNVNGLFVGSSIDTNSTSDATRDYSADIYNDSLWPVSKSTNPNWYVDFNAASDTINVEDAYPRDVPITSTNNFPNGWEAENAVWTYERWAHNFGKNIGESNPNQNYSYGGKSALQLEGRGKGKLAYVSDEHPQGLEYFKFDARLAQFNDFGDFAYYYKVSNTVSHARYYIDELRDYTFTTFGALTLDKENQNFDSDGSISLVAYYDPTYGAYEARISRGGSEGDGVRIMLLKWYSTPGGRACEVIGTKSFEKGKVDINGLMRSGADDINDLCRLYISAREYTTAGSVTGTLVYAGVSCAPQSTSNPDVDALNFVSCVYFDTNTVTRLRSGTFGVLSRNCAGVFLKPIYYDKPIKGVSGTSTSSTYDQYAEIASNHGKMNYYTGANITFDGSSSGTYPIMEGVSTATMKTNRDAYYSGWTIPPGRMLKYRSDNHPDYWGFESVTNFSQTIAVETTPHGRSSWQTLTNITVASFANTTFTNYLYTHEPCDVRLKVGGDSNGPRIDVTVDNLELAKWAGETTPYYDTESNAGLPTNYVYTSAWIVKDDDEVGQKAVRLQPARATNDTVAVSLRSPVMNGAGLFHFNWRKADTAHVKLLLQSHSVKGTLRNATKADYNDADNWNRTYHWKTIETIELTEESGGKTIFINDRHYAGKDSVVLRIVVAPDVVAAARAGRDPHYGSIEITDAYVQDLPPYDDRSWTGWNFRADGWRDSTDTMWANLVDYDHGLSGLLNNTVGNNTLADKNHPEAYKGHMPYVQSPTFATNCIGSVEFRARLYDPAADSLAGHPAVVTIYGAKREDIDETTDEPKYWNKITDIEVSGTVYEKVSAKFMSGDQYCVLRFSVSGVDDVTPSAGDNVSPAKYHPPLRVAIDDICMLERPIPSIRFKKFYARPFRNAEAMKNLKPVLDIATSAEQPILEEQFGFQAEIEINDLEGDIVKDDPAKPIKVYVAYYPYTDVWGWRNWISTTNETDKAVIAELVPAEGTNLVYRSSFDNGKSFCPAQIIGGDPDLLYMPARLVQYHFFVTYYDKDGNFYAFDNAHHLEPSEWSMPEWNRGFEDPNSKSGAKFSAFTLLETLAPNQVWFNEVNINDYGDIASETNQWIEIAVPSGVDMEDWYVRYYNNFDVEEPLVGTLFDFSGRNATRINNETEDSGHYSFYVAKSPKTTSIPDDAAHAIWNAIDGDGAQEGFLPWACPCAFELVRPTGVIEHSVVIQGYNEWENSDNEAAARIGSGTNFLDNVLMPTVGGDWVWGEVDRWEYPGQTVGVTNGMGRVHADWSSPMLPTPGAINVGQTIGDWYIAPNGGLYRVYSNISGDHIGQLFGGYDDKNVVVTVAEGASTNIFFTVDRWYKLAYTTDHPEERTKKNHLGIDSYGRHIYELSLNNISNNVSIAASADIADEVSALMPADSEGEAYTAYRPAIMKWLENCKTGKNGDVDFLNPDGPLTNAVYRGHDGSMNSKIDLVGMYWLDLDPTKAGWELWGGMGEYDSGVKTNRTQAVSTVVRTNLSWNIVHTNLKVSVWLMITNSVYGGAAYAPYRLQGLNNEQSDKFSGHWDSETFKITMRLSSESGWRDGYHFIFNDDSFYKAGSLEGPPFTARIEIQDPHARYGSRFAEYDWWRYPNLTPWERWEIDVNEEPQAPDVLRKENDLSSEYF